MSASPFHVKFDLQDYSDILPPIPDNDSEIINSEIDNIYEQHWRVPDFPHIIHVEFLEREVTRIKHGVWILIKGVLLWIPGNYYFFLVYGNANGDPPQFRLKRLKNIYKKIRVRKNPRFVGTFNIKNRQDGDTTMGMSDILWEIPSGELVNGLGAIQSKTRSDAQNPCWFNLKMQWMGYPKFLKDEVYNHFTSGNNIEEKLTFSEPADPDDPRDKGKNVIITYGPSTHNAFDGKNNIRKMFLDEILKWLEAWFYLTFTNYMKFMMPGKIRKGIFDIVSSPADTNGRHNDEGYQFWKDSDPDDIQKDTGSTKSRVVRLYSNPLEGIEGFYDIFGDADPQEILEHIHRERNNKPKDLLMAEVRGFPLPIIGTDKPNEDEIFGATDQSAIWINISGIKSRKTVLSKVKATKVVYGNYIWPNNIQDSGIPEWVTADKMNYDEYNARFCINDTEAPKIELADLREPPKYIEECLGVDPFNLRYAAKNQVTGSLGAGISWKFRDILQTGKVDYPTLAYLSRPQHGETFYEDMIKAAVARRAKIQYENSNDKLENYVEDRKYDQWMIDSIDAKPIEVNGEYKIRKGDAPSGKGATAFMNEGINLINGHTNLPLKPTDPYLLDYFDFEEVLDDIISFNRGNTQQNHFTMALIQALLGKTKLMFQKRKKKSNVNNNMLGYMMS